MPLWTPLDESRVAGESGHMNDTNAMHEWANTMQEGEDRTYFVKATGTGGDDSYSGKSWHQAFNSLARAAAVVGNGVSGSNARIYLGPGQHNVNSPVRLSDAVQIIGVPMTGERAQTGNGQTYITNTGANIDHYIRLDNNFTGDGANIYDVRVKNIHFNALKVNTCAIYTVAANNGEIRDCRFTRGDFGGAFQAKHLVKQVMDVGVEGTDGSWWNIVDNFCEHAALYHSTGGWWLNGINIIRNIGISIETQGATIPYVTMGGQGGRNVIANNSFEMIDSGTHPAIDLYSMYQVSVYGNGFERLMTNRAIHLRQVSSSIILQGGGETSGRNSGVWEWNGSTYAKIGAGWSVSPYGSNNLYGIAGDRTLL